MLGMEGKLTFIAKRPGRQSRIYTSTQRGLRPASELKQKWVEGKTKAVRDALTQDRYRIYTTADTVDMKKAMRTMEARVEGHNHWVARLEGPVQGGMIPKSEGCIPSLTQATKTTVKRFNALLESQQKVARQKARITANMAGDATSSESKGDKDAAKQAKRVLRKISTREKQVNASIKQLVADVRASIAAGDLPKTDKEFLEVMLLPLASTVGHSD